MIPYTGRKHIKGHKTVILEKLYWLMFRYRIEPEDIEMVKDLWNEEQEETYEFDSETEQRIEESDNNLLEEIDKENNLRPIAAIRNQESHEEKQHRFPKMIKSTRAARGIWPPSFGRYRIVYKLNEPIKKWPFINECQANLSQSITTLRYTHNS